MRLILKVLIMVGLTACGADVQQDKSPEVQQQTAAVGSGNLAGENLLIDTHIDTPYRLLLHPADISVSDGQGQFNYPLAREGGLDVAFMSIYIPAKVEEEGGAKQLADDLITSVEAVVEQHPDQFVLVTSTDQVLANFPGDRVMLAMGMENGGPIEGNLENLHHFYERGIRYITLTHSKSNHIADSSYDENRQWKGLSEFGKTLVVAMNRAGMMIDISHVSDDAFYQVLEITNAPVVATHSSARHFTPGFERNMDDDMIRALGKNGGVMQVTFGSGFVSQASRLNSTARDEQIDQYLAAHDLDKESEAGKAFRQSFVEQWDYKYADLSDVLDHIDHIRGLIGVDHIGFGSDFEGVGDSLPVGLKDVSDYPNLIRGLVERGYPEPDVKKIMGGNLMRVWKQVEEGKDIQ